MPNTITTTSAATDPAALVDELHQQFAVAHGALRAAADTVRRLEQRAAEAQAAADAPKIIRVRTKAPVHPLTGDPIRRGPGRPRGARNGVTLWATQAQVEELRRQLA